MVSVFKRSKTEAIGENENASPFPQVRVHRKLTMKGLLEKEKPRKRNHFRPYKLPPLGALG